MIIQYIKLKNFRQYSPECFLEFSSNHDKNITLVIAENGVGKTTLLQAFRYCFYGSLPNLIKLPKPKDLLTNSVIKEINENEQVEMFVEVKFSHDGKEYLSNRKNIFKKVKGKVVLINEEYSMLESSLTQGFKKLSEHEAKLKMWSILPPELSHIFMFDGERAEKRIESLDSREFLKESILGVLNIKRIDELIKLISNGNKKSVIKHINNKFMPLKESDKLEIEKLDKLNNALTVQFEKLQEYKKQKEVLLKEYNEIKEYQVEYDKISKKVLKRNEVENNLKELNRDLQLKSEEYIRIAGRALKNKFLLDTRRKYEKFMVGKKETFNHYKFLHVDTLTDILEKGICVCGRPINMGSEEEVNIHSLFEFSLPMESSHYLNEISNLYYKATEYKEQLQLLKDIKDKKVELSFKIRENEVERIQLNKEITLFERELGENRQERYDEIINQLTKIEGENGQTQASYDMTNQALRKQSLKVKSLQEQDQEHKRYINLIKDLEYVTELLSKRRDKEDYTARTELNKNFNYYLNEITGVAYTTSIDEEYKLTVIDESGFDVTETLSTGQSVAVALTFLKALLDTTKSLSRNFNSNNKYSVIMDAAMSNVDEKLTGEIASRYFNDIDQLIFLSFKKQVRDEYYSSVKNNIGKAYNLFKTGNKVSVEEISLENLNSFIHTIKGNKND